MAPGASINVDVGALRQLAGKMRVVQGTLVSDTGMFSDGTNGVEHPELRNQISMFEERWSDKRNKIHEALGKTAEAFNTVAESFEQADRELGRQLGSAGDGAGGAGGGGGAW